MRVLVACEFSGIVREAFRRRGHDAWSCDLLPSEIPGQHIQARYVKSLVYMTGRRRWNKIGRLKMDGLATNLSHS